MDLQIDILRYTDSTCVFFVFHTDSTCVFFVFHTDNTCVFCLPHRQGCTWFFTHDKMWVASHASSNIFSSCIFLWVNNKISGGSRISRRGGRGPRTGGRGPPRWLHFENFACQNERIWTRRGGARRARPPLDPPMKMVQK